MKKILVASVACLALAAPASAIVYNVNVAGNGVSANGSVTTDGTTGALSFGNITDWTFNLDDGFGTFTLNGTSNSGLLLLGTDLTATATGLFFDFSGSGAALFQNPSPGSGINFVCFTGGTLCGGGTNRISVTVNNFGGGIAQQGVQQIGRAAIPEPANWALMIAGFGMAGAALRTSRRARVSFAAA